MKKGTIITLIILALAGCFLYTHRRVIKAFIKGEPMPQAPKWHFWVKNRAKDNEEIEIVNE